jgi:hypothetical protein
MFPSLSLPIVVSFTLLPIAITGTCHHSIFRSTGIACMPQHTAAACRGRSSGMPIDPMFNPYFPCREERPAPKILRTECCCLLFTLVRSRRAFSLLAGLFNTPLSQKRWSCSVSSIAEFWGLRITGVALRRHSPTLLYAPITSMVPTGCCLHLLYSEADSVLANNQERGLPQYG